ncbi:hypothetical protein KC351_g33 [Hortaea werneckii]|nr:hypothetical protein KC351_g33 [Hortaea werneckii]
MIRRSPSFSIPFCPAAPPTAPPTAHAGREIWNGWSGMGTSYAWKTGRAVHAVDATLARPTSEARHGPSPSLNRKTREFKSTLTGFIFRNSRLDASTFTRRGREDSRPLTHGQCSFRDHIGLQSRSNRLADADGHRWPPSKRPDQTIRSRAQREQQLLQASQNQLRIPQKPNQPSTPPHTSSQPPFPAQTSPPAPPNSPPPLYSSLPLSRAISARTHTRSGRRRYSADSGPTGPPSAPRCPGKVGFGACSSVRPGALHPFLRDREAFVGRAEDDGGDVGFEDVAEDFVEALVASFFGILLHTFQVADLDSAVEVELAELRLLACGDVWEASVEKSGGEELEIGVAKKFELLVGDVGGVGGAVVVVYGGLVAEGGVLQCGVGDVGEGREALRSGKGSVSWNGAESSGGGGGGGGGGHLGGLVRVGHAACASFAAGHGRHRDDRRAVSLLSAAGARQCNGKLGRIYSARAFPGASQLDVFGSVDARL